MYQKIYYQIKQKKAELKKAIKETGKKSIKTQTITKQIDKLIVEYYKSIKIRKYPDNSNMPKYYVNSYIELKKITDEKGEFPKVASWNKHAQKENLLSNVSMQYISMLTWWDLGKRIEKEVNFKK